MKRVLEEERIEHRKELESLEYKLTSSLAMQTSLTEKHSELMKQTRDNYEAKISE